MQWSRELKIAHRSLRTVLRAASAMAKAQVPEALRSIDWADATFTVASEDIVEVTEFGSNPGRLAMFVRVPHDAPPPNGPLVVLLHGCGQSAAGFAQITGWTERADELRIPLILPEQSGDNNHGRCFNWFRPAHARRGLGEALSIRQMVAAATRRFGSDPNRVFIAGLSAGGAMTAALLAAYPDVFTAGAVVAGVPVGAASSTSEALARMAEAGPARPPAAWAEQVRRAAPVGHAGPWPRLSIWHGDRDRVVDPMNATLLTTQWTALHGLAVTSGASAHHSGAWHESWGPRQSPAVERWSVAGLAHDWPRDATNRIAEFWGLRRD